KRIFRDIKVWCLPQPHADINDNKNFLLSDLKPEFHARLEELREYMGGILTEPHTFGGRNIAGGATLQPLMGTLCDAVSTCKAVRPLSMMESIEVQVADSFSNRGVEEYEGILDEFDAADVWVVQEMEDRLQSARTIVLAGFDEATKDLQERVVAEATEALQGRMNDRAHAFRAAVEVDRITLNQKVEMINNMAFKDLEEK
ncbi:unnamed protein product, partial [Ectocarpus sp. 12 AP-2014]